jgi:hypothetical protein
MSCSNGNRGSAAAVHRMYNSGVLSAAEKVRMEEMLCLSNAYSVSD